MWFLFQMASVTRFLVLRSLVNTCLPELTKAMARMWVLSAIFEAVNSASVLIKIELLYARESMDE